MLLGGNGGGILSTNNVVKVVSKRAGFSSGPFSSSTFYLQNSVLSEWAMLDSNQRLPPCKGGKGCF